MLAALERAGERGITQVDFLGPTIDGGKPITRVAARVKDLKDAGHSIVVDGERNSCVVYKLAAAATPVAASPPPGPPEWWPTQQRAASGAYGVFD